jgi:glycosyltransferase involved in cell wall biosynthesis
LIRRLPDSDFIIYEPADCRVANWFGGFPNVTGRRTPVPSEGRAKKVISGFRFWSGALSRQQFDIFEQFNLPLVSCPSGQTLLTIHDIRGMHPEAGSLKRVMFKAVVERSLSATGHVVTVSQSMKREILDFFPEIPISVIYNGFDATAYNRISAADVLAVRTKFSLPAEFILSVGHMEKRKNYPRLVEGVALLRDRGVHIPLIIIGNDSGERRVIEKSIKATSLSDQVRILGGLTDLEVGCAYKLCSLFAFPSAYEGFGIPILEAMAAGCPMVLSDIPVFREITQDRAAYFPHDDVGLMAEAIETVLCSSHEQERLVEYGKERVQAFSFKSLAEQMEGLYRSLA